MVSCEVPAVDKIYERLIKWLSALVDHSKEMWEPDLKICSSQQCSRFVLQIDSLWSVIIRPHKLVIDLQEVDLMTSNDSYTQGTCQHCTTLWDYYDF